MHPYTVALMSAVPDPRHHAADASGNGSGSRATCPSPINPPPACRFHTRCWKAQDVCRTDEPPLVELAPRHQVACHFPENAPDASAQPGVPGDTAGGTTP